MNQRDIAKLAGVSSATVSRVINNDPSVSAETNKKVSEVIKKYGYVQNAVARNLRLANTKTIGYLVPDISNPFFPAVLGGIERICNSRGYDIIFENTDEDEEIERKAISSLLRFRVDGLIAVFVRCNQADLQRIKMMGIPVVLLDRKIEYTEDYDYVGIDNIGGLYSIVEYLYKLGHRKISIIYGSQDITPGYERLNGYKAAMKKFGIAINEGYLINGDFTEEGAYKGVVQLFSNDELPTAIITCNNLMTMGAYKAIIDMGIKIPDQVSLIGFDDFDFATHLVPPITVVSRATSEMGKLAAEFIIDRIDGNTSDEPRRVFLPTKLIARGSCSLGKL
ncbi:MAG: LacI family DNA-binding transcriptional regulator [Eubacteriales bacterium]|nr:LacI family DNA-binding transcriptional regulator [Eubacteriales bacterium]